MDTKYHEEHTWVRLEDDEAYIGISDYAQNELGEIVYVDLAEEGDEIIAGEEFGQIESTKTVSDMIAPISGEVIASNKELEDEPSLINSSPENQGWIIKVKPYDLNELDDLMEEDQYKENLEELD